MQISDAQLYQHPLFVSTLGLHSRTHVTPRVACHVCVQFSEVKPNLMLNCRHRWQHLTPDLLFLSYKDAFLNPLFYFLFKLHLFLSSHGTFISTHSILQYKRPLCESPRYCPFLTVEFSTKNTHQLYLDLCLYFRGSHCLTARLPSITGSNMITSLIAPCILLALLCRSSCTWPFFRQSPL